MQQAIITRQSPAPIGMPVTRRPKVHRPATGNQAATKGNHRSRSHLKAAEPRSGNLQTSGQEQAAGRILQRILKHIV